jgi:anti-sigma factor RsiW
MDYLTGERSASERAVFDEHIEECPDCKSYLAAYRETVRLSKAACQDGDDVPGDVPEDLVRAILAARTRHRK